MSPIEAAADGFVAVLVVLLAFYVFYYGAAITMYVLGSLGLYTIAKRREIKYPWMAWVPGLSFWTLGSVSDQYQYVVKGKIRSRRKWMVGLVIAVVALMIALYLAYFIGYFKMLVQISLHADLDSLEGLEAVKMILEPLMPALVIALVCIAVSIVLTVFQYLCYYHLFASCDPDNKVLYLVLSILFSFLLPIFTFVCRKKDLGMPPRKDDPVAYIPQPAYGMPAQTAEPWTQLQEAKDGTHDGFNP